MEPAENAAECEELVQQLHEPASRRSAMRKLVAARAVGPVLKCLDSTNDSVVWAAVVSLGQMRATEAAAALVDLLERGVLVSDVCEALSRITRQEFGADVRQWRQWMAHADVARPPQLDAADCIQRTAHLLGVKPTRSARSYRFKMPLAEGRGQTVAVYFGQKDAAGNELVVIYSECGPASPQHYEAVLRKNMSIAAGAFAIRDVAGTATFVLVDIVLAASVTPSVLAKTIENVAAQADLAEKALTDDDRR